ncbi:MAG: hypothetical protein FWC57_06635 [Endomicrobia bacterium]|nr:hypothetical protein [Endomicrobiia bacterium]
MNVKAYKMIDEITKLYNRAAQKAQQENREHGLPNVFYRNGRIVYELPNGKITTKRPK